MSSVRRTSQLPLLHSGAPSSSQERNDPDYSSPSLPFSPYSPPNLLSSRFNHDSESDPDDEDDDDEEEEDSDRTENDILSKPPGRPKVLNKRPTYGNQSLFHLAKDHPTLYLNQRELES